MNLAPAAIGTAELRTQLGVTALTFAKAILKAGYYRADHQAARAAAAEFVHSLGRLGQDFAFIEFRRAGEHAVWLVSDALEPTQLEAIIGSSGGPLFDAKLGEWMTAHRVSAMVLRAGIAPDEVMAFFPVLEGLPGSDPAEVAQQLAAAGVLHASLLIDSPGRGAGRKLSWNLDIAVRRLHRDIATLPLFRDLPAAEVDRIHRLVARETVRGLRRADLLAELIVNADLLVDYCMLPGRDWVAELILSELPSYLAGDTITQVATTLANCGEDRAADRAVWQTNARDMLARLIPALPAETLLACEAAVVTLAEAGHLGDAALPPAIAATVARKRARGQAARAIGERLQWLHRRATAAERIDDLKAIGRGIQALSEQDPQQLAYVLWQIAAGLRESWRFLAVRDKTPLVAFVEQLLRRHGEAVLAGAPDGAFNVADWDDWLTIAGAGLIIELGQSMAGDDPRLPQLLRLAPPGKPLPGAERLSAWVTKSPSAAHKRLALSVLGNVDGAAMVPTAQLLDTLADAGNEAAHARALALLLDVRRVDRAWAEAMATAIEDAAWSAATASAVLQWIARHGDTVAAVDEPLVAVLAARHLTRTNPTRRLIDRARAVARRGGDAALERDDALAALAALPHGRGELKRHAASLAPDERARLMKLKKSD